MKTTKLIKSVGIALLIIATSAATTIVLKHLDNNNINSLEDISTAIPTSFTSIKPTSPISSTDFTLAAEKSVECVVHVKVKIKSEPMEVNPIFEYFFGRPNMAPQEQSSAGSGVIISPDGYIVTNNHVVDNASEVEVTLNDKRTYTAKVIGVNKSTDIALIKIEETNLPAIALGNSDNLKVGEWVLAVGNPFNLTSTVTAGIVSAKARNINILNAEMKIESFIQTDAAVNPGNSGGALVNTRGELIGINTAIASRTGSYSGYSFAVPISIVSKVVADLKEFGVVQRAVLGVQIMDINSELAKEKSLQTLNGVYVAVVNPESSAEKAGIEQGDIITAINGIKVKSSAELQEQVGRYRPGDKIKVEYLRGKKNNTSIVELTNRAGTTEVISATNVSELGATFKPLDSNLRRKYRLNIGIQVDEVERNGKFHKAGIPSDFIILKINGAKISSEKDIESILENASNASEQERVLFITGAYKNGDIAHFAINLE